MSQCLNFHGLLRIQVATQQGICQWSNLLKTLMFRAKVLAGGVSKYLARGRENRARLLTFSATNRDHLPQRLNKARQMVGHSRGLREPDDWGVLNDLGRSQMRHHASNMFNFNRLWSRLMLTYSSKYQCFGGRTTQELPPWDGPGSTRSKYRRDRRRVDIPRANGRVLPVICSPTNQDATMMKYPSASRNDG